MRNILIIISVLFTLSLSVQHSVFAEDDNSVSTTGETSENLEGTVNPDDETTNPDTEETDPDDSESEVGEKASAEQKETAIKDCNNMFESEGLTGNSVCKNVQTTAESQMIIDFYTHCKATNGGPGDPCRENTGYGLKLNEDITKGALESGVFSDQIAFVQAEDVSEPIDKMGFHVDVFCSTVGASRCLELHSHYILKLMQGDNAGATALYNGDETTEQKYLKRQLESAKDQEFFFEGKTGRSVDFKKVCDGDGNVKKVLNDNFYIGDTSTNLHNSIDVGSNLLYTCASNPSACDSSRGGSPSNYKDIYSSNIMKDGCNEKFSGAEGENYLVSDTVMNDMSSLKALQDADSMEEMMKLLEGLGELTEEEKKYVLEQKMKKLVRTSIITEETNIAEGKLCQEAAQLGSLPLSRGGVTSDYCKEVYFLEFQKENQEELDAMSKEAGTQLDENSFLEAMKSIRESNIATLEDTEALDALAAHQTFQEIIVYEIRNNPELIASTGLAGPDGPVKLKTGVLEVLEYGEEKYGKSVHRDDFVDASDLDVKEGDYLANVPPPGESNSNGFGLTSFGKNGDSNGNGFNGNGSGSNGSSGPSEYGGAVTMNTPLSKTADFSFVPRTDNSSNIYSYQEDIMIRMDEYVAKSPKDKAASNTRESDEAPFQDYFNELTIDFGSQAKVLEGWQRMDDLELKGTKDCSQSPLTSGVDEVNEDSDDPDPDGLCQDAIDQLPKVEFDT